MRIGILGGSFDPPHMGHLVAAEEAKSELGLDAVRFVPAHRSPFKSSDAHAPVEARVQMVGVAIAGNPAFQLGREEVDREPPSYTVDTLRQFAAAEPGVEWTLLMGVDQWASFGAWKDPVEIARLARVAVLARDGQDPAAVDPGVAVPWVAVPVPRIDVSSSLVRDRLRRGRSIRYLVPDGVRQLIVEKGLYASC